MHHSGHCLKVLKENEHSLPEDLNTFFDSGKRGSSVSESSDRDKQSGLTSTNGRATPKCVRKRIYLPATSFFLTIVGKNDLHIRVLTAFSGPDGIN